MEKREHGRLPVTLSARVHRFGRVYRTEILDVGAGGLLLQTVEAFQPLIGDALEIEATLIGRLQVEVIAFSHLGIHVRIQAATPDYHDALRRLSVLATTWRTD